MASFGAAPSVAFSLLQSFRCEPLCPSAHLVASVQRPDGDILFNATLFDYRLLNTDPIANRRIHDHRVHADDRLFTNDGIA